jgi:hypothetical protein
MSKPSGCLLSIQISKFARLLVRVFLNCDGVTHNKALQLTANPFCD